MRADVDTVRMDKNIIELRAVVKRYEFVRTLTLQQFADIQKQRVAGVASFDALVDKAMKRKRK